jgi:tetratricopeptide (TPR) repeat protein
LKEGNLRQLIKEEDYQELRLLYEKDQNIANKIVDILEDNDEEVCRSAVSTLAQLSFEDFDFYAVLDKNLKKMENRILKLLNHKNPKIRSSVAFDLSMFSEDENGLIFLLEKAKPILYELLNDDDLNVQKDAGFSLSVLSSIVYEKKEDYEQYLEITNALTKNVYVLAYLKERTRFLKIDLPYLNEISNSPDGKFKQEANSLIKIIETDIDPEFISEIEKKEEKKHVDADKLFEILTLTYDPTPEQDIEALELINKALDGALSITDIALVHYLKGAIFRRQNHLKEALNEIKQAIKIDPKFGESERWVHLAWTELAGTYGDIGNITKCIETIQEKIKILPTYFKLEDIKRILAISYLDLALVFKRHEVVKSSDEKFLHNIQQAIKFDSEYPDLYFFLGLYYLDKDLYHRTKENFERYLELSPYETSENKEKIEEVKETLEKLNEIFE